jgi:hypothetical protein
MRISITLALLAAIVGGIAAVSATAYARTCTTSCYGNTCTTNCY